VRTDLAPGVVTKADVLATSAAQIRVSMVDFIVDREGGNTVVGQLNLGAMNRWSGHARVATDAQEISPFFRLPFAWGAARPHARPGSFT